MILVDANLLVYAANRAAPEHERARTWLDQHLSGTVRIGFPWPSLLAFVRIVSNPAIVRHPVTPLEGWRQAKDWLGCEAAWIPLPGTRHTEVLGGLLEDPIITSRLVPDAHLAALAIEHGLTRCSTDGDFARVSRPQMGEPACESPIPRLIEAKPTADFFTVMPASREASGGRPAKRTADRRVDHRRPVRRSTSGLTTDGSLDDRVGTELTPDVGHLPRLFRG